MQQIDFRHGGPEYDADIPTAFPRRVEIDARQAGPAFERPGDVPGRPCPLRLRGLIRIAGTKSQLAGRPGVDDVGALVERFTNLAAKSPQEIADLYNFKIRGLDE